MKLKYFLPAFFWAIIILIISLFPANKIPAISILDLKFADKIIHFLMYFFFAGLISIGFYMQNDAGVKKNYFISFIIPFFFAFLTEILQLVFISGRAGDFYDFLANLSGIFAGIFIAQLFSKTFVFIRYLRTDRKLNK